jgi:hypothetical protein
MPETEAERLEREKREKEQQQGLISSLLDKLNPFSDGFGIGSIFSMLAVAVVGYFVARNDAVQEWLGGMMDEEGKPGSGKAKLKGWVDGIAKGFMGLLPDSWKANFDVTDEVRNASESDIDKALEGLPEATRPIIKNNRQVLLDLAIDANGGKITADKVDTLFTRDTTLFAMITKQPTITKDILASLGTTKTTPTTEEGQKTVADIKQSIKAIINDDRLDVLLGKEHRANTIEMMLQMGGKEKGLTAAVLDKKFTDDLAKNGGKASTALRELLTSMVDTAPQPLSQEATQIATDLAYETVATQIGPKNRPALDRLKNSLGKEGFDTLIAAFASGDNATISVTCLQSKNIAALTTFAKSVESTSLPAEFQAPLKAMAGIQMGTPYQKALSAVADKNINPADIGTAFAQPDANGKPVAPTTTQFVASILRPNVLQLIADAGVENVATIMANNADPKLKAVITPQNLQTITQFAVNVHNIKMPTADGHIDMKGVAIVTGALMELAINQNGQPMQKNAALIAGSFSGSQFAGAFKTMIDGLKIPGKQALLTAMSKEWGTREDGLLEILASAADVKRLPDVMKDPKAALSLTEMSGLSWLPGQTKIGENLGHLKALDVKEGEPVKAPRIVTSNLGITGIAH